MEIEGIEIIGPYNQDYREKLKAVRLIIDGQERSEISLNEQMAPAFLQGCGNAVSPDMRDYFQRDTYSPVGGNYVCTNLGKGMLAGGSAANATPKVGPGQDLLVKVLFPKTTEGGASTITSGQMRVRLHTIQVRTEEKLRNVLEYYGHMPSGGQVNAGWTMGDLENTDDMPIKTIAKMVPESGSFGLADWTRLHGGNEVDLPKIERYITYAQNGAATTPNSWYDFTMEGQRITNDFQQLEWNYTQRNAVKIEHIGVLSHNYLEWLRLWVDGKPKYPEYRVDPDSNQLPMPQSRYTTEPNFQGPARLGRPMWVWNQHGSIQVKDNGTAVPAWSTAPTRGAMVAVWGHKYYLRGDE